MTPQSAAIIRGSCDVCEGVGDILEILTRFNLRRIYRCVPCWRRLVAVAETAIDEFVQVGGQWPKVGGGR